MSELKPENIITLRSVFKFPKAYMEPAIDPKTGRMASHVRRVDDNTGIMIMSEKDKENMDSLIAENDVIEIFDGKTFDLDNVFDKAWWEAIKFSKRIAQERWTKNAKGDLVIDGNILRYGSAEFYVEKVGQLSKQRVDLRKQRNEAEQYIFNDTHDGLYQKVRLLGNPMNTLPMGEVQEYLLDIANKTPDKIKTLYTSEDSHLRLLLLDAIDKQIIRFIDKLYQYGEGQVLGASQDAVMIWFKNPANFKLLKFIKQEVYPEYYQEIPVEPDLDLDPAEVNKATNRGRAPRV